MDRYEDRLSTSNAQRDVVAQKSSPDIRVALLRGINVGRRNRLSMEDLRALCGELGLLDVQTYIQSGNTIFRSRAEPSTLEAKIEHAIETRLGLKVATVVRTGTDWARYSVLNPFPDQANHEPSRVMLALSKKTPAKDAAERLYERAADGEQVVRSGDSLWLYFPKGSGRSKLSPSLIDRLVGSPVTTRNWRTVQKIASLLDQY